MTPFLLSLQFAKRMCYATLNKYNYYKYFEKRMVQIPFTHTDALAPLSVAVGAVFWVELVPAVRRGQLKIET